MVRRNTLLGRRLTTHYASIGEGLMEKLKPKYLSGKMKFRMPIKVKQRMGNQDKFQENMQGLFSKKILDFIKNIRNILLNPFKYQETNCIFAGEPFTISVKRSIFASCN